MQPPFDRDFPSLAGRSNVGKSWHSGNAPPEQQWTRLANAPDGGALSPRVSSPRVAEPAETSRPVASKLASGPIDVPVSHSRMADTLQQVVPNSRAYCIAKPHDWMTQHMYNCAAPHLVTVVPAYHVRSLLSTLHMYHPVAGLYKRPF